MKKKITIAIGTLLFFMLIPLLLIMVFFGSTMSSASDSLVADYQTIAEEIGTSWQEILAFDTVRFDNDFSDVDPNVTAMEFLIIYYKEYRWIPPREDDGDDTEGYWSLIRSGTLDSPDAIRRYFHLGDDAGYDDVKKAMESYKQPRPYEFVLSCKDIETVMEEHNFDAEQRERMGLLITEGLLSAQFGDTVPGSFDVHGNGYFEWPLPTIPTSGVTSSYGNRLHPVYGDYRFHYGQDIACSIGTPVIAVMDAVVQSTGFYGSAGNYVILQGEKDGMTWTIKYFHLSEILCRAGQEVKVGDVVAASGNTGVGTGPHLHIETICNGVHQDPLPLIMPKK